MIVAVVTTVGDSHETPASSASTADRITVTRAVECVLAGLILTWAVMLLLLLAQGVYQSI